MKRTEIRALLREMGLIVVLAAAVGIAWNHRMLIDSYQGRAMNTGTSPASATNQKAGLVPLPLGLMQVKELFDGNEALFIDARDSEMYKAGHLKKAISIPLGEADSLLPKFAAKTPRERLLVVYCNGFDCHDSKNLGDKLIQAGFQQVFLFEGGYPEWRDAGYPVEGMKGEGIK